MANILIAKYSPSEGHLGEITYRACAYIENCDDPSIGRPIPLTLRAQYDPNMRNVLGTLGASRDVVDETEVAAAIAELERRVGRKLPVRRSRC